MTILDDFTIDELNELIRATRSRIDSIQQSRKETIIELAKEVALLHTIESELEMKTDMVTSDNIVKELEEFEQI